jgi:hypothetical protein
MRHDPPEYQLVADALTGVYRDTGPAWDWDRTVALAAREEILPALHGKLRCPAEVADFLDGIHELNAARNRQLLEEVEELAGLLNRSGIEPVLLKGAAYLVGGVYADPADRWLQDIDFLVSPDESRRAFEIVKAAGYEPYVPNPSALVLHHLPSLSKPHRVPVEIHHHLGCAACTRVLTASEVLNHARTVSIGRATVRIPSAEHLMTHLILHSQIHHGAPSRIWPTLRSMLDLVVLRRAQMLDWGAIRERFASGEQSASLEAHLRQIEATLAVSTPFPISAGGVRWQYRRLLWREPRLRFMDPFYTASRVLGPKLSLAGRLLSHAEGRKYLLSTPFRGSFYKRLFEDLAHG